MNLGSELDNHLKILSFVANMLRDDSQVWNQIFLQTPVALPAPLPPDIVLQL